MDPIETNSANADFSILVQTDQLQLLYRQSFPAIYSSMISAVILTAILWPAQSHDLLLSWFGLLSVAAMARFYLFMRYNKVSPQGEEILSWERPYFITLMLSSSIWGIGGLLIIPPDSQLHLVIIFSFLVAMSGGAIAYYSSYSAMATATISIMLLPIAGYFFIMTEYTFVGIAIATIGFFVSAIRASRFISLTIYKNLIMTRQLEASNVEKQRLAYIDDLTGLNNRRAFYEFGKILTNNCQRSNNEVSMIHMDIDNFKIINDTYGHAAGDTVLKKIGQILSRRLRKSDVFARIGGEEFGMLLSTTSLKQAVSLAEKLRLEIEQCSFMFDHEEHSITASFGVTSGTYDIDTLVKQSDQFMFLSKQGGRNRVTYNKLDKENLSKS